MLLHDCYITAACTLNALSNLVSRSYSYAHYRRLQRLSDSSLVACFAVSNTKLTELYIQLHAIPLYTVSHAAAHVYLHLIAACHASLCPLSMVCFCAC